MFLMHRHRHFNLPPAKMVTVIIQDGDTPVEVLGMYVSSRFHLQNFQARTQ